MSSAATAFRVSYGRLPRSVLVIPPRAIIEDELRALRLEEYLQAEFPRLTIVMAEENVLPGNQSAVGVLPDADGSSPFDPAETQRVMDDVSAAMAAFVDYRRRWAN